MSEVSGVRYWPYHRTRAVSYTDWDGIGDCTDRITLRWVPRPQSVLLNFNLNLPLPLLRAIHLQR
jgi:hypothetical protein